MPFCTSKTRKSPIFGHIRHIRKFGFVSTNYSSHPYSSPIWVDVIEPSQILIIPSLSLAPILPFLRYWGMVCKALNTTWPVPFPRRSNYVRNRLFRSSFSQMVSISLSRSAGIRSSVALCRESKGKRERERERERATVRRWSLFLYFSLHCTWEWCSVVCGDWRRGAS